MNDLKTEANEDGRTPALAVATCSADPLLVAVNAALKRVEDLRSACAEVGQYTAACQLDDACDALQKCASVWNHSILPNVGSQPRDEPATESTKKAQ